MVELEEQNALRMMKSRSRWEPTVRPEYEGRMEASELALVYRRAG